jgi:hypothetical protein
VWAENFKKFLYEDSGAGEGYSLEEAEAALQAYFKEIMKGTKPSKSNASVFYMVRNGALSILRSESNQSAESILDASYRLGVAKNRDYGTDNILKYGVIGIIVRLNDKISRLMHLLKGRAAAMVLDEKIEDTAMDMINYSTYGIMLCNGVWL